MPAAVLAFALTQGFSQAAAAQPAETVELSPVLVQSTRTPRSSLDTPASISRIDGQDLLQGRPGIHLSESLAAVPGIQAQNRNNNAQDLQVSIRGFGARSTFGIRGVRIYVDGIPATMPDGQGQLSNIDLASAESVEVLRGPYSAVYGNSSGGIIQVATAPGKGRPRVGASLLTGSDNLRRYGLQASGGTDLATGLTDYNLSASRMTLDGYRDHSKTSKTLANARLGFQFADDSALTLIANHVDMEADDPLGLTEEDFRDNPRGVASNALLYDTRKTVRQSQLGLNYEKPLAGGHTLQAIAYAGLRKTVQYQAIPYNVQQAPTHAGGVIDLGRDYAGLDLRWTARSQLGGRPLTLVGGVAYDHMKEHRQGFENFTGPAGAPGQLGVKGGLRRDESNTLWNLDPYLQASLEIDERWTLDAGLRYSTVHFRSRDHYIRPGNPDDSGSARYQQWLPVIALRYALSPDTSLYATAGRGFETPTFNELSYRPDEQPGLNFALQPSASNNYEIGVKHNALGGLLTAALFRIDTNDEIVSAGSRGGRATFRNAGDTRRHGIELSWSGRVAGDLVAQASYTWLDARLRNPQGTDGTRIPGVARQNAYASLAWAPEQGWQAGMEWRAQSRIQANSANTASAPGYGVAALYAGYRLRRSDWDLDAFVRFDNLFDRHYAGSVIVNEGNGRYYEPASGRNWAVSLNAGYRF